MYRISRSLLKDTPTSKYESPYMLTLGEFQGISNVRKHGFLNFEQLLTAVLIRGVTLSSTIPRRWLERIQLTG